MLARQIARLCLSPIHAKPPGGQSHQSEFQSTRVRPPADHRRQTSVAVRAALKDYLGW